MTVSTYVPALSHTDSAGEHTTPLARASTTIGRSPDRDLVLLEPFVSRQHAVIAQGDGVVEVVDQGSTHGTYVNGVRVRRASLQPEDVLQFGSLKAPRLRFHLQRTGDAANPTARFGATDLLATLSGFTPPTRDEVPSAARSMEQLNFLLSAARQLNAGGAVADIFRALLQLTLQLTGVERGFVYQFAEGELKLGLGLNAAGTVILDDSTLSQRAMQKAISSDKSFLVSDTLADDQVLGWSSVMMHAIRSIYCIPLRKRGAAGEATELLGLLYLDSQIGPGNLSEIDHQMLDTIAMEAAALLHNALMAEEEHKARVASEELAVAARIHSGLMSIKLPVLQYAGLRARSVPCLAIGGDFFDAVALDDCLGVTIADVSGKGVSAAIVAATLQGIIHAQMLARQSLPEIASLVNKFLCTRKLGKYATMVMLKLYPDGRVEYVNCGHLKPLRVMGDNVTPLDEGNLIVGLIPSAEYASATCRLGAGERILLATDGLTEAEDSAGEAFGDDGLCRVAQLGTLDAMLAEVAKYHFPNQAEDDCTLIEVQYLAG